MPNPALQTSNASWTNYGSDSIQTDSVNKVVVDFLALDHGTNAAWWRLEATLRCDEDGPVAFVGLSAFDEVSNKTLGASAWDVRISLSTTSITYDVKGGIGQTVDWYLTSSIIPVYGTVP